MEYLKKLKKQNEKIAELLNLFNKYKIEGTCKFQVDNLKYITKEDFKTTGAMVSWLYHQMTESWRDYIVDMEKEVTCDNEVIWRWKFNEKGQKIYNKIANKMALK
jgi:hypothetical protein